MFKIFNTANKNCLDYITNHTPDAISYVRGNKNFPNIDGKVKFYQINNGVLVLSQIDNLPDNSNLTGFFGMHIHDGEDCEQTLDGNFKDSTHYNPNSTTHPKHAGDLPPILSNEGSAFSVVLTNRFNVKDIVGKTIMIHENPDDFRTDPSGNSGSKIACGKIITRY